MANAEPTLPATPDWPLLLSRGYELRSRYHPGRTQPAGGRPIHLCDDSLRTGYNMIDATRTNDNLKVIIRHVPTNTDDLPILLLLSSPALQADPRNCTIPILDIIILPQNDELALIFMKSKDNPRLFVGLWGQDRSVPEMPFTIPSDPLKVDVYQLGNVIKKLMTAWISSDPYSMQTFNRRGILKTIFYLSEKVLEARDEAPNLEKRAPNTSLHLFSALPCEVSSV
ncbi:hypothetical protein M413DRAFT_29437 [Hebeloma cylindrosporum]|uniref:Protein kinase domain-containing protein n=1 Tax=Hebeloma cylindrosporum TaxID=76867 RepID=A0A0C3BRG0_HEBCY|nr:hypothetical protein M413DRAFT_29437 [Hebeloma cylindrosporum h7]